MQYTLHTGARETAVSDSRRLGETGRGRCRGRRTPPRRRSERRGQERPLPLCIRCVYAHGRSGGWPPAAVGSSTGRLRMVAWSPCSTALEDGLHGDGDGRASTMPGSTFTVMAGGYWRWVAAAVERARGLADGGVGFALLYRVRGCCFPRQRAAELAVLGPLGLGHVRALELL